MKVDATTNPALGALQSSEFRQRIERHLQDVEQGVPERSAEVAAEVTERHQESSEYLAYHHPDALSNYLGLLSGLSYSEQVQVKSSVSLFTRYLSAFQRTRAAAARAYADHRPDHDSGPKAA